jgi:hypothetical protein
MIFYFIFDCVLPYHQDLLANECVPPADEGLFQGDTAEDFLRNTRMLARVIKEKHTRRQ